MDDPGADPAVLADCLDHLARLTALTGARRALAAAVVRRVQGEGPVTVADGGAGGGDVIRYLEERLGDRFAAGICVEPNAPTAACGSARSGHLPRVCYLRGDVLALPLGDGAVDVAMMNMALHHVPPEHQRSALEELGRVARAGVVVTDLAANALNRIGARLLSATVWRRNPLVRADAPVSVERGFSASRLADLGRDAGLRAVHVGSLWGHRLVLTAEAP
jgi:ubiquinone/menaquinone biosynthesis C-methylase UbiE